MPTSSWQKAQVEALGVMLEELTEGRLAAHYKQSYAVRMFAKDVIPLFPCTVNFTGLIDRTMEMRTRSGCDDQLPPVQYDVNVLPPPTQMTRQTVDYDQQRLAYELVVDLLTTRRNDFQHLLN